MNSESCRLAELMGKDLEKNPDGDRQKDVNTTLYNL